MSGKEALNIVGYPGQPLTIKKCLAPNTIPVQGREMLHYCDLSGFIIIYVQHSFFFKPGDS